MTRVLRCHRCGAEARTQVRMPGMRWHNLCEAHWMEWFKLVKVMERFLPITAVAA